MDSQILRTNSEENVLQLLRKIYIPKFCTSKQTGEIKYTGYNQHD